MNTLRNNSGFVPVTLWILLASALFLLNPTYNFAQCTITASAADTVVCGDCIALTAFGQGQGQNVFSENFNSGTPSGWAFTQQATFNNPCSPGGVDGTTHIWMGNQSGVPRVLRTVPYNFTTATSGVTICFDMLFAEQAEASPCEGPDEPNEGVDLQYSIDGGATWVSIHYFDPNGGYDPILINWNNWCFQLPAAAITSSTQIRWFQDNDSGADYDHWGIDNVNIYYNDPTYNITWQHDGYSYGVGSSGGANPNLVCPHATTTYTVNMTNGTTSCSETVTVNVINPTIEINAGNDTTICAGDCADIFATAKVIKRPAKTPTYENNEFEVIAAGFGETTEININVTGLNATNVTPGLITEVCINNLTFFGTGLDFSVFPPTVVQQDIGDLVVSLICPDGTIIQLVPAGVTGGSSGYNQTCFVPSGGNIAAGSSPYTGQFSPNQSFNNLVGCTSNGVWTMQLKSTTTLGFGIGTFFGWSISFDDPEISYTADFTWSPTTNMAGANTLTPTVCPATTTTYTLTATDTAGCVTVTDQVTVTVGPVCCAVNIDSTQNTNPSCGASDGSIVVVPNVAMGASQYSVDGGLTYQPGPTFNNLPAGNYTVILQHPQCNDTLPVALTNLGGVSITNVAAQDPTCGLSNSSITITAIGATQYSIDNGVSFQAGNSFTGLAAGNYNIVVEDAAGCQATATQALVNLGSVAITNVATQDPTCGSSNGSITITATGATQYSIDNGVTFQAANGFAGLAAGNYNIVVEDATGCQATSTANLSSGNTVTIILIYTVNPLCGLTNGIISIDATNATLYSIDNGVTFQADSIFFNLAAGTYQVVVKDAAGCQDIGTATLTTSTGPVIDSVVTVNPSCGVSDGQITIYSPTAVTYSINNGTTFQAGNSFSGLAVGTYTIVVKNASGCQSTSSVSLANISGPTINIITPTHPICGASNGNIVINATGTSLQYSINNGTSFQGGNSYSNLAAGTYNVVVKDQNGCQSAGQIVLTNQGATPIDSIVVVDETCASANGSIAIYPANAVQYSIDNGVTFQASNSFLNLPFGTYDVVLENALGCLTLGTATIANVGSAQITQLTALAATCGFSNGSIQVIGQGQGSVTFSIDNGVTFQATGSFSNLAPGFYDVVIEDATGCQAADTITVPTAGVAPVIDSVVSTSPSCGANDGSIAIYSPLGASFSIDNGTVFQPNPLFNNLAVGTYNIVVHDANGCESTTTATLVNLNGPTVTAAITDATCNNANGAIDITVTGGAFPYLYAWGFTNTQDISNQLAGNYTVTVIDDNNCSAIGSYTIANIGNPVITAVNTTGPNCGATDATIAISATGATQYSIDNGVSFQASPNFSGLAAGTYDIVAADATGCQVSQQLVLANSAAPLINTVTFADPNCGNGNGSIIINAQGGVAPLQYSIDGGLTYQSTASYITLDAGTYTVFVMDAQNCEIGWPTPIELFDSGVPSIAATVVEDTCGSEVGSISLNISGGTPGYTLNWSHDGTLNGTVASNLGEGTYTVLVIDQNTCEKIATIEVPCIFEEPSIYIPNAFSPNGDGRNDVFYVYSETIVHINARIFDRWGELVFRTNDQTKGWDGTHNGVLLTPAVFVYQISVTFANDTEREYFYEGSLTLLR